MKTMDCKQVRRLLVALADNELTGPELVRMQEHLAGCAVCRRELAELKGDAELLRQEPAPEVPGFFPTRIMARIRSAQVRPVSSRAATITAMAFACAAGLVLGIAIGRGIVPHAPDPEAKLAAVWADCWPGAGGGR